jgi:hypothetical protein
MEGMKRCTKCGDEKPLSDFYLRSDGPLRPAGRYRSECKTCMGLEVRDWMKNNPERVRNTRKKYRATSEGKRKRRIDHLMSDHHYTREEAEILDPILENDRTTCTLCGIQNKLVKEIHKNGGPFFVGSPKSTGRMHPDRIDPTLPHSLANTQLRCPNCNLYRGAAIRTDEEIFQWVSQRWNDYAKPCDLYWLNTSPGKGGRPCKNLARPPLDIK